MQTQSNPYTSILTLTALPLIWLMTRLWGQREQPAIRYFLWFVMLSFLLVVGYANELLSTTLLRIHMAIVVERIGQWGLVAFFMFALAYSGYDRWLTRRNIALLFVVPVLSVVLLITNTYHGFVYSRFEVIEVQGLIFLDYQLGWASWLWVAYLHTLTLIGAIFLIFRVLHDATLYREQVFFILLGITIPAVANVFTLLRLSPYNGLLDITPFAIPISAIPLGISIMRYDFAKVTPVPYIQVVANVQESVIVCNMDERIIYTNPAASQFLGDDEDYIGQSIHTLIPELQADDLHLDTLKTYLLCRKQTKTEEQCHSLSVSPLHTPNNEQQGWILILRNVTAERIAQTQAVELALERERLHLLEAFIRDMSHDFRTPLTMIMSSAQLIDMQLERAEAADDWQLAKDNIGKKTAQVESSTKRILNIIQDMIDVARLEHMSDAAYANASVNVIIAEQVGLLQQASIDKHIRLNFDPCQNLPLLPIDVQTFGVAIHKLLDNALRYTPENGTVTVSTRIHEGNVLVDVTDTGIGIDPTQLSKIFHRFYRGDPTRPTTQGGAGLGLAIVKRVVDAHGGKVSVRSKPNEGSTFRISLPLP